MTFHPFPSFPPMTLDRLVIHTPYLELDRHLTDNATLGLETIPSGFRFAVVHVHSDIARRHYGDVPYKVIQIDSYRAIELFIEFRDGKWVLLRITFNPGRVLFGHNAKSLDEQEFLLALSVLLQFLLPLLQDPDDFIHLIPGLHARGRAWWRRLEFHLQVADPDRSLLRVFSNARHPSILKGALRCPGESIKLVGGNNNFSINIYYKDLEVLKKARKHNPIIPGPVLRIEVALGGPKLIQYLGSVKNTERIEGKSQLVRFRSADIIAVHRKVCLELLGCKAPITGGPDAPRDNKWGRMLGMNSYRTGESIEDQLAYYAARFGLTPNTRSRLLIAAEDEFTRHSQFCMEDLISAAAWENQPIISFPELEAQTQERHQGIDIHPLVMAAYGTPRSLGSAESRAAARQGVSGAVSPTHSTLDV